MKNKVKQVLRRVDTERVVNEYKELFLQVEQVFYIRELVRKYEIELKNKLHHNNILIRTIYVALANFDLLCLWKPFDNDNRSFSLEGVGKKVGDERLRNFYDAKMSELETVVCNLKVWRCKIVAHRDAGTHFNSGIALEKDFPVSAEAQEKVRGFLFAFLCKLKETIYGTPAAVVEREEKEQMTERERFFEKEARLVLKTL